MKEKELKEKELKEKELKEKELKNKELKEKEVKDKEVKEKEVKQKEVKDKDTPKVCMISNTAFFICTLIVESHAQISIFVSVYLETRLIMKMRHLVEQKI